MYSIVTNLRIQRSFGGDLSWFKTPIEKGVAEGRIEKNVEYSRGELGWRLNYKLRAISNHGVKKVKPTSEPMIEPKNCFTTKAHTKNTYNLNK